MLKNGPKFGKDYFDELLVKIKEIRASERRFYQKITDIYKECSYDYDKNSDITKEFYKNVQNKLHYAITGMTAPEIIYKRVDSKKDHMGLQIWKNVPDGKIKREIADKLALDEYEKYRIVQDQKYISDFDELLLETKNIDHKKS